MESEVRAIEKKAQAQKAKCRGEVEVRIMVAPRSLVTGSDHVPFAVTG